MKLPIEWLKKFVDLNGIKQADFLDKFAKQIVDIDAVIEHGKDLEDIKIGKIIKIVKHPNAEKLLITKVSVGKKNIQIVTGASNVNEGDFVPIIEAGSNLPDGTKIEKRQLRGENSEGMMCSEKELGLGADHEGIMILNNLSKEGIKLNAGDSFTKALNISDTVLDLDSKIITNRAYCFGIEGLAREVSVLLDTDLKEKPLPQVKITKTTPELEIKIEATDLCSRYSGIIIRNVKIKESPFWLKNSLIKVGIRPINNVVDITNYIMYETGQPLHAFDYETLTKDKFGKVLITVRKAKPNEEFTTLDGVERKLSPEDLLITDSKEAVALAGIMGGLKSEVTNDTKTILLEAARFNPISTRKTARKFNLPSEASIRFEKGLDPNITISVIQKTLKMFKELADASSNQIVVDSYPKPVRQVTIKFDTDRIEKLIGTKIPTDFVERVFKRFLINIKAKKKQIWELEIPTYRTDIKESVDLIEDIGRMYNYDSIPSKLPSGEIKPPQRNYERELEKNIRTIMTSLGYNEVKTPTFVSTSLHEDVGYGLIEQGLKIINPASLEYEYLRPELLPSLIAATRNNAKNFDSFSIFELDKIYKSKPKNTSPKKDDHSDSLRPEEIKQLGGIFYFKKEIHDQKEAYLKVKGHLEYMLRKIGIDNFKFETSKNLPEVFEKDTELSININNNIAGFLGFFKNNNLEKMKIDQAYLLGFTLSEEILFKNHQKTVTFRPYSIFPPVKEDFTFDIKMTDQIGQALEKIKKYHSEFIASIEIYDIFETPSKKSFSIHLNWQSNRKTLTAKEIQPEREAFIKHIEKLGIKIRSSK